MRQIYLLAIVILTSFTLSAQDCVSLGCSGSYTITTDDTQPDQPSGPEWGCYNGYPRKQTIWQYFYSDLGGNYTQSFACAADLDWLVYDMGTSFTAMTCPVDPSAWTQIGCDLSYNPGGPTGPGVESTVTTTAGHYYAIAIILWEPLNLTFTFGNPQLGGNNLSAANCLTSLPVKLIKFSGVQNGNDVLLNWIVGEEKNVARYEVQGSTDGQNFHTAGNVAAANQSNYQFLYAGAVTAGMQYYRLRMVDIDGKVTYSDVLKISAKSSYSLTIVTNPVASMLTVTGLKNSGELRIIDLAGKTILKQNIHSSTVSIDASRLHAGLYAVQYTDGNNISVAKFLKQ